MKSTVEEIRARFDADVERFSNAETGQTAQIDNPVMLELVARAAAATCPEARDLLDVGCGAGNFSLRLLERLPGMNAVLLDLSGPMLERAKQRVGAATAGRVATLQGDIREIDLGAERFDVIVAASVLHHLRADAEWEAVFAKFHRALRPGGSVWISDLVEHDAAPVEKIMQERYGEYLVGLKGDKYRDEVFGYVEREDTPRSVLFQIEKLRAAGFADLEILHKNTCFASFGGVKRP